MEQSSPGVLIYLLLLLYCNTLSFLILGASVKELRYDFTVTEGVDPGKVIGRLELDTDYTYRLNDKNSWFNFDSESGELICISRLDRESLASDRVDLVVLGTPHLPSDPTLFISVRITVADVNDNAPSFPFPFQNVSVPESARLGSQLVLPSATDPDSGENGRIAEYKILSGNEEGVFKLSTTAEDRQQSSGSLLLLVDKELDRERKMLYNLNISATDAGHPQPLSAYLTVFVNVLDANDNAPTFDKSNLHVTVSEKVEKEQHILTVSALDADSGQNAKIYYQLTSDPDQQFEIDSVTGRIKSKVSKLQCPKSECAGTGNCSRLCIFSVEAVDGGVPAQRGRAFVHVRLLDENDHAPQILFRMYPSAASQSATVSEDKAMGHVVAVVTVLDNDVGANGKTDVVIQDGNLLNHFRLEANEEFSLLRVNAPLDRKKISLYNLTISATDHGSPPKSSQRFLPIYVRDANDKPPKFTAQSFTANITDNAPIGSYVIALTANHIIDNIDDQSTPSKLTFDILSGNEKGLLSLDTRTGLITVAHSLFRQKDTAFNLRVSVKGRTPGDARGSVAKLKVNILADENNAPVFSRSVYEVSLREDAIVGTTILHLTASDPDSGPSGQLHFAISPEFLSTYPDHFKIVPDSGVIRLGSDLDREAVDLYRIPVTVHDSGNPPLFASSEVILRVEDINDNRPIVYPSQYYVNALSSLTSGAFITQVHAIDLDSGINGRVQYHLTDSPPGLFSVDQSSGRITLLGKLPAPSKVTLTVSVADAGNIQAATNATVHIYAIQDLALKPTFKEANYEFTVTEDSGNNGKVGRVIGTVSATDFDKTTQVQYYLVSGDNNGLFDIGQFSGEIRSSATLDREDQANYELVVVCVASSAVAEARVVIILQDVNDNQPIFLSHEITSGQATTEVHRDWPIGYAIFHASATDQDMDNNGYLLYSMKGSDDGLFTIESDTGLIALAVPGVLLPPEKDSYRLTVEVSDAGIPPKTNAFRLYVNVLSKGAVCDTVVLSNNDLKYSIPENTPVNTLLDKMSTIPERTSGIIFSSTSIQPTAPFGIFPDGWLYVKNKLDYETQNSYTMQILMQQRGNNNETIESRAFVHFAIIDVNDNAPVCSNQGSILNVAENLPPLSYVGTIAAEDRDSGLNGKLVFKLLIGSDQFILGASSGELRTLQKFDRETLQTIGSTSIFIRVQISDQGSDAHTTECELEVKITDVNDEKPQFSLEMYYASIPENTQVGNSILQVTATDADQELNAVVTYKIMNGNGDGQFNISQKDGLLVLAKLLDRELIEEHRLTINAEDSGNPQLNATTYATIKVLDVNDEAPQFIEFPSQGLHVQESTPLGSVVAQFTAVDSDLESGGTVQYLLSSGNIGNVFELDSTTGTLYIIRALDFESVPAYTLTVTASDMGSPPLRSTVPLLINVIDVNDNSPVITSASLIGQVEEGASPGTPILQVTATDADNQLNGMVKYELMEQIPAVAFKIHSKTGILSTSANLDRESISSYSLKLKVSDSPLNISTQLFTQRTITVIVTDSNDHAPEFVGPHAAVIHLSDVVNRRIAKVVAADADSGINGSIGFKILDGNTDGLFKLDIDGSLFLRKQINNAKAIYRLTLEAMDRVNSNNLDIMDHRTTSMQFTLITMGTLNAGLRFSEEEYHLEIAEDTAIGTQIASLPATYSGGSDPIIEYYVTEFKANASSSSALKLGVDIDPSSGVLRVIRALDRESTGGSFSITVVAVLSEAKSALSTRCQVHVRIIDVNDEFPKTDKSEYVVQVNEDVAVASVIATVSANDPDLYSQLTYKLKEPSNHFFINSKTGDVSVTLPLDREKTDKYSNIVDISDGVHSTTVPIVIEILDANDNVPEWVFSSSESIYTFHVREGAQRNSFIGRIHATDKDMGDNARIKYDILSGNEDKTFFLDENSGLLTVNGFIDHEKQALYQLEVLSVDGGAPSKRSTTNVVVLVDDVNDNPPIFIPNAYEVKLYENATLKTPIVQLFASDMDISSDLHYAVTSGDPWNQFHMTSNGTLELKGFLDRETRPLHQLTITVRDAAPSPSHSDKTVHLSTATVAVNVLDVNDNWPKFTCDMNVAISGRSPIGTIVAFLTADDPDEGLNGQVQFQFDSHSAGPFSIDPVLGHVTINQPLTQLRSNQINLTVWAIDSGSPERKQTKGILTVQIINNNLFAPTFKKQLYEINVSEDTPPGTSLLQLSLADTDIEFSSLAQFWVSSGDETGDFLVTPDTGIVSVARQLDYEHTSSYNITVFVSNPELSIYGLPSDHIAQLIVQVEDVNDQSPVFLQNPLQIQVVENLAGVAFPAAIGLVEAIDGDSGLNGKLSFSIISGNATVFRINSMSGLLSLTTALDREHTSQYTLIVQATDSGVPRHMSKCTVNIEVLDANDNSPVFDKPYYIGQVTEGSPQGTRVIKVQAEDNDNELNGLVRYSLSDNKNGLPFTIDEESGWLIVKDTLDRELNDEYIVEVVAKDGGSGIPLSTTTLVTVVVIDANDNSPTISNKHKDLFIQSSLSLDDFVYAVDAIDLDQGNNSRLLYSISGKDVPFFTIDQWTGVIRAKRDLGSQQDYSLNVKVEDGGEPSRQDQTSVNLHTRPSADFPVFKSAGSIQSFQVSEYDYGATILVTAARSPKRPPLNRLHYSIISGNVKNAFAIDPLSGHLTSTSSLDREKHDKFELWISASDNDNPPLSAHMSVLVIVTDENDHAPRFSQPLYHASLNEDQLPLTVITQVKASDMDSGENAHLSYSILHDGNTDDIFTIDSNTGQIMTANELDREKVSSYRMLVEVKDNGEPSLKSQALVLIDVLDINDNAPKFTRLFMASVPEDAAVGTVVTQVTSSDLDSSQYSNNTYYLSSNPGDKFAIDPVSGELTVAGVLDRESVPEYPLKVIAVDGSWRIETSVTVTIQDTNDQVPQFSQSNYRFSVAEMQPVLSHVGRVLASDADQTGPNSQLIFSLLTPTKLFRIDPITGDITTLASLQFKGLDSSDSSHHKLVVLASDHGTPPLEGQAHVIILVTRKNEQTPKFHQIEYETAVTSETPIGSQLIQIVASDEDKGTNGMITYEIQSKDQQANGMISIDPQSGWIITRRSISVSGNTQLAYLILAKDGGNPAKSAMAPLIVHLAPKNSNGPVFSSGKFEATVEENGPLGQPVLHVLATDQDDGINGKLTYHLKTEVEDSLVFKIEPTTGLIVTNVSLDYEAKRDYELTLICQDNGWPIKQAETKVVVHVVNKNDNPPIFKSSVMEAFVPENSPAGTLVYVLSATDKDKEIRDKILYSLIGGRGAEKFTVNEVTGQVTIAGLSHLDYEETSSYELKVQARNSLTQKFRSFNITSEAQLIIHVTSKNEFAPKFTQKFYSFRMPSSKGMQGRKIGSVSALDADAGPDGVVFYYFGSKTDGFKINQNTGELYATKDYYQSNKDTVLTIVAKNRKSKSPLDQDECQVQIIFDNSAKILHFSQATFTSQVSEDASIGTSVVSLGPYIQDVPVFDVQFSITEGNNGQNFMIDETGFIQVSRRLDRESQDVYNLTVIANLLSDSSLSTSAFLSVLILDVNDNAPVVQDNNRIGRIVEGDPIGISIMTLLPMDQDLDPNRSPFSFRIVDQRSNRYFEIDSATGVIKSKVVFNREEQTKYEIKVEISDAGKPRRTSVTAVTILIADINDSPSINQDVHVQLMEMDSYQIVGPLTTTPPADNDITGNYTCRSAARDKGGISIDAECNLIAKDHLSKQSYSLTVYGSDGMHTPVNYSILVDHQLLSQESIQNAVEMMIDGEAGYFKDFIDPLNSWLNAQGFKAHPISFDIPHDLFLSSLRYSVFMKLVASDDLVVSGKLAYNVLSKSVGTMKGLNKVSYDLCTQSSCHNGGTCMSTVILKDTSKLGSLRLKNGSEIISYPLIQRIKTCNCSPLYTGSFCELSIDQCANGPCRNGGSCTPTDDGTASCLCAPGFDGDQCEHDVDECLVEPCRNGGFCENIHGSYKCICLLGFSGDDCQYTVDHCSTNPCLHGGKCIKDGSSFNCRCSLGYSGDKCQVKSYGFGLNSYVELSPLNPHQNIISMEFATTERNALLLYSYNSGIGSMDYVGVDIVDGVIRLSARLAGQGQMNMIVPKHVSDGQYHQLLIEHKFQVVTLTVADCSPEASLCQSCQPGDSTCSLTANTGLPQILVPGKSILVGGIKDFDDLALRPGQLSSFSFVGCLRSFEVNGKSLEELEMFSKMNVLDYCPRSSSVCSPDSCGEGALACTDKWDTQLCACQQYVTATHCNKVFESRSFIDGNIQYTLLDSFRRNMIFRPVAADSLVNSDDLFGRQKRDIQPEIVADLTVALDFKTSSAEGLLFLASSGEDFTMIDLINGSIRYISRRTHSLPLSLKIDGDALNDDNWHRMEFMLADQFHRVELKLDGTGKSIKVANSLHPVIDISTKSISLGGTRDALGGVIVQGSTINDFTGCLRRFLINNEVQPLDNGQSNYLLAETFGELGGHCGGEDCHTPPCIGSGLVTGLSRGVLIVVVFFVCLLVCMFIAFLAMRRFKSSKRSSSRNSSQPTQSTKLSHIAIISQSGMTASAPITYENSRMKPGESGMHLLGDGLHSLIASSHSSGRTNMQSQASRLTPPDLDPAMYGMQMGRAAYQNRLDPTFDEDRTAPEQYDLDNASSIAPSDIDVSYHYRGFRESLGKSSKKKPRKERDLDVRNSPLSQLQSLANRNSSSASNQPSSVKQLKAALRASPGTTGSSDEANMQIRQPRSRPGSSHSSKRRTSNQNASCGKSAIKSGRGVVSVKDLRRYHSNPSFDDDESSSSSCEPEHRNSMGRRRGRKSGHSSSTTATPRILSRSTNPPHPADYSSVEDSEGSDDCSDIDKRPHIDTETESELGTVPSSLAPFRPPRSMFPVSEDESASDLAVSTFHSGGRCPRPLMPHPPPIPPRLGKAPTPPHNWPNKASLHQALQNDGARRPRNEHNLEAYV